MKIFDND